MRTSLIGQAMSCFRPVDDGYLDVTTVTLPDLKWRWVWDPLRSDLRFEKIVASLAPE
jgi:hypothetical protein